MVIERKEISIDKYIELRRKGVSHVDIAKRVGIAPNTLSRAGYLKRYREVMAEEEYAYRKRNDDNAIANRRAIVEAKRKQVDAARDVVVERYGSVGKAPDDSDELKELRKLNDQLAKIG